MKKTISDRIKITKTGKLLRRHMGIGHFRAKRNTKQRMNKKGSVLVDKADIRMFKKYL